MPAPTLPAPTTGSASGGGGASYSWGEGASSRGCLRGCPNADWRWNSGLDRALRGNAVHPVEADRRGHPCRTGQGRGRHVPQPRLLGAAGARTTAGQREDLVGDTALHLTREQPHGHGAGDAREGQAVHRRHPGRRRTAGVQAVHQSEAPGRIGQHVQGAPAARGLDVACQGAAHRARRARDHHEQTGQGAHADQAVRARDAQPERDESADQCHMAEGHLHRRVQQQEAERGRRRAAVDRLGEQPVARGQQQPVRRDQAPRDGRGERDQRQHPGGEVERCAKTVTPKDGYQRYEHERSDRQATLSTSAEAGTR